jgi:hypothetical protein
MTEAIEQEATSIFAAELATFLDAAIAKLDALGARPPDQSRPPEAGSLPEEVKPAKKLRKKKAPSATPPEGPTIDPALAVEASPSDAAEHPVPA